MNNATAAKAAPLARQHDALTLAAPPRRSGLYSFSDKFACVLCLRVCVFLRVCACVLRGFTNVALLRHRAYLGQLADFGLARWTGDHLTTPTAGTKEFMAPEVAALSIAQPEDEASSSNGGGGGPRSAPEDEAKENKAKALALARAGDTCVCVCTCVGDNACARA
jgi:hypothetical protein